MRRLQRFAVILSVVLAAPSLIALDTSKHHRIALNCVPGATVRVRLFDQNGVRIQEFENPFNPGAALLIAYEDTQSVEAPKRYVSTSASQGCIQGRSERDPATEAPINKFVMPCNLSPPVDLVIAFDPPARFVVRREIRASTNVTCRNVDTLDNGSPVRYYTSDEKLTLIARDLSNDGVTCYLELSWKDISLTTTTTLQNPNCAEYSGSKGKRNSPWKSLTITRKSPF